MKRRVVSTVVAMVILAACGSSDDGEGGGGGPDTEAPSRSRRHAEVAIVGNDEVIAITDGHRTVDLIEIDSTSYSTDVASADELVALSLENQDETGSPVGNELVLIDTASGDVQRRDCPECNGVAILDDSVVTVDTGFTMQVFDTELALQATIPVDHVTGPPPVGVPPDPSLPQVRGVVDGRVAVSYLASDGSAKGGPDIVSLYHLDGTLDESWPIAGRVFSAAPDAAGDRMALGVGGAGGVCYTLSVPVILDPRLPEPIPLVNDGFEERSDAVYLAEDLWWNGDDGIVTFGGFTRNAAQGCTTDYVFRQFDTTREITSTPTESVSRYRFLGAGCDRALLVDKSDEMPRLSLVEDGQRQPIDGYDRILWTAPRSDECTRFPGVE